MESQLEWKNSQFYRPSREIIRGPAKFRKTSPFFVLGRTSSSELNASAVPIVVDS